MGNVKGVGVDKDAKPLNEPVTVLVTPSGNEIDADDWSHANNLIATGCRVKDGWPTSPGDEPSSKATSRSSTTSSSTASSSSTS